MKSLVAHIAFSLTHVTPPGAALWAHNNCFQLIFFLKMNKFVQAHLGHIIEIFDYSDFFLLPIVSNDNLKQVLAHRTPSSRRFVVETFIYSVAIN